MEFPFARNALSCEGDNPPGIKHMNSNLKTTKETLAILRCTDSNFYSHLEKKAIKPIKLGTRSFFTLEQIEVLKNSIDSELTQTNPEESGESIAGVEELIEARQEIQMLLMQVSQWQRQAQTYQEQYQKLLNSQQEEKKAETVMEKTAGEKRWWDIFFRRVI